MKIDGSRVQSCASYKLVPNDENLSRWHCSGRCYRHSPRRRARALWQQSKYDEFEKGTARGVAINSDGSLSLAPAFTPFYTSPSTYLWDLASDSDGNVYAAAGSPARVYKITPDGKASVIFAPQELAVQALAIDGSGAIYAATSPDGKVYKIVAQRAGSAKSAETFARLAVAVDPAYSASCVFRARRPNTSGRWRSTSKDASMSERATGAKSFASTRTARVRFSSRAMKPRSACWRSTTAGNLIAGTDGSGLVYRISPQGEGFVLYSAPKKEITALAVDAQGNIYAAGAGDKRGGPPPTPQPSAPSGPASVGPVATVIVQQAPAQATGGATRDRRQCPFPT